MKSISNLMYCHAPDYADLINLCQPGDPSITYWKDVVKNLAADHGAFC